MITRIYWDYDSQTVDYRGYDVHVIRNGLPTAAISRAIMLVSDNTAVGAGGLKSLYDYINNPTGNDPDFDASNTSITPSISNGDATTLAGNLYSVYNVTFNRQTCIVTASPFTATPERQHFNFHIEFRIKLLSQADPINKYCRIHIHNDITRFWLTPVQLTVRAGNPNCRFSIYAQFSDNTVGDISCHPGFTFSNATPNTNITYQNDGRIAIASTATIGSTATVIASLATNSAINNVAQNLPPASAIIRIEDSWSSPVTPGLVYKVGAAAGLATNPESTNPANADNVLFLADGFKAGDDEQVFYKLSADAAKYLRESDVVQPWKELSKRKINYWHAFIPSNMRAASCMNEVVMFSYRKIYNNAGYTFNSSIWTPGPANPGDNVTEPWGIDEYVRAFDDYLLGWRTCPIQEYNVDSSKAPGAADREINRNFLLVNTNGSPALILSTLISKVGLPTPLDFAVSPPGLPAANAIRSKWKDLYDKNIITAFSNKVPQDTFDFWINMNNRRMINERDTVLGISTGFKPQMRDILGQFPVSKHIQPHPFRASRTDLDGLLGNLRRTNSTSPIGNFWQTTSASRSKNMVVILSLGTRYARCNSVSHSIIGVGVDNLAEITSPLGPAANLAQVTNSSIISVTPGTTNATAMELNIQPYYTPVNLAQQIRPLRLIAKGAIAHGLAHAFPIGAEYGNYVGDVNNDTAALAAVNAGQNTMPMNDTLITLMTGPAITSDQIKWRWPRIKAAGTITSAITAYTVPSTYIPSPDPLLTYYSFQMLYREALDITLSGQDDLAFRVRNLPAVNSITQLPPANYSPLIKFERLIPPVGNSPTVTVIVSSQTVLTPAILTPFAVGSLLVQLVTVEFWGTGTVTVTSNVVNGTISPTTGQATTRFYSQFGTNNLYYIRFVDPVTPSNISDPYAIPNSGPTSDSTLNISVVPAVNYPLPTRYLVGRYNRFAELVDDMVQIAMNSSRNPMTAVVTGPMDPGDQGHGGLEQAPVVSQVRSPFGRQILAQLGQPSRASMVVGLYAAAGEYNYGGYHPTGYCLMRDNTDGVKTFCPVCRYVMVDTLDPSAHRAIDLLFRDQFKLVLL